MNMGRKIIRVVSVCELVIAVYICVCLSIEFKTDAFVMKVIAEFDMDSKLYNICLYAMPCVHIIVGLLGIVFDNNKKLMLSCGIGALIFSLVHCFYLQGYLQVARAIPACLSAIAFLYGAIRNIKETDE